MFVLSNSLIDDLGPLSAALSVVWVDFLTTQSLCFLGGGSEVFKALSPC